MPLDVGRRSLFEAAPRDRESLLRRLLFRAEADLGRQLSRDRPCHRKTAFLSMLTERFRGSQSTVPALLRAQKREIIARRYKYAVPAASATAATGKSSVPNSFGRGPLLVTGG